MATVFSSIRVTAFRLTFLPWLLALFAGVGLVIADFGNDVEQRLSNVRANIVEKPASGDVVLVEIDAESLQKTSNWPFSREYYAVAIEKLNAAGAALIAFDIDFSSQSTPQQDQRLADAIENSDATIILATFRQPASTLRSDYVESLPIPVLRKNAFSASVNVHPDSRGQLNRYSYGLATDATPRPSMASMIAEVSGDIDQSFAIDQSIDPDTIPRLSFVDLINSNDLPAQLFGKKILIGATAIELGDRYSTGRFGMIPGVVIQAMASETLIQGTNLHDLGKFPAFALAASIIFLCVATKKLSSRRLLGIAFAMIIALVFLLLVVEYLNWFTFSNVPALFFLGVYMLSQKFLTTTTALKNSQYVNEISDLPNEAALQKILATKEFGYIATARLADFRELLVLTNTASRKDFFQKLADRLSYLAQDERVYHVDPDMVAWIVKTEYTLDIRGHFDAASALLQAPIMAHQTKIKIETNFGISSESLDQSKIASEHALLSGKKWAWHDSEFDDAVGQKHNLLIELDQAIKGGELDVVYQPKWDLSANMLGGAEALVRWRHQERGFISPELFIPLLEKAGRIDGLTCYVLQKTLDDLTNWEKLRPGLSCSVNISAKLLGDRDFVNKAIGMVENSSVDNGQIVFEVTETATLKNPEKSALALKLIQSAGIRVSIDDYGTGHSTMSYLQRLPVDEVKLDQSFVKTMITNSANRVMVLSTIKMAHALGYKIVAEGIEDQPCLELLTRYGCDYGQGWHISKPLTSEQFEADWLDREVDDSRLSA
ncbi:EAL domain-containing protein [Parasphingorhabdus sp.]|uniref:EAL domain-containing protein n=1 Tax=Parasphingorhabdus sp. TaxID=2709688 RepID=UPI003A9414DE